MLNFGRDNTSSSSERVSAQTISCEVLRARSKAVPARELRKRSLLTIRFVSATKRVGISGIAEKFFELSLGEAFCCGLVGDGVAEVEELAGGCASETVVFTR